MPSVHWRSWTMYFISFYYIFCSITLWPFLSDFWPFWCVAVLVVAVLVCGRFGCHPSLFGDNAFQKGVFMHISNQFARWRDWYHDIGKTCLGGGMHCRDCPSASSSIWNACILYAAIIFGATAIGADAKLKWTKTRRRICNIVLMFVCLFMVELSWNICIKLNNDIKNGSRWRKIWRASWSCIDRQRQRFAASFSYYEYFGTLDKGVCSGRKTDTRYPVRVGVGLALGFTVSVTNGSQ